MRLSVIIITRNEQANIEECLKTLDFADEIIVLDFASIDQTVEIARSMGATVHVSLDWPGFGLQKNRALALAKGDWVLSIDADERVSTALRTEIENVISLNTQTSVYRFPRRSRYCGQFMSYSGWSPDWVTRLFRRDKAIFSDSLVHEKLLFSEKSGSIFSPLLHLSFPDFESVLDKANRYSSAGAQTMLMQGKKTSLMAAIAHGMWAFFRTYVLRAGFLDGVHGLALSISNAQTSYYKYVKLWAMQQTNNSRR